MKTLFAPQSISKRFPALEEQEVEFTFYALDALVVQVAGTFNHWYPESNPLTHTGAGDWSARIPLKSGQYEYRFVVDGEWADDPRATQRAASSQGGLNSVVKVGLDDRTDRW